MRLVQNKLGNEPHFIEKGLMTRAAALINVDNAARASKIVDHGTSGNFQSIKNTLGVLESTRFQLNKPVTIGMGSGTTVAHHGALVEDCAPHHSNPNVGVVLLDMYLFPHPWRADLSLMSPTKMLLLGVSVCSHNMARFPPYLLSRNTYANGRTTHDDVNDLPAGTVATKLAVAANGLMLFNSHRKSAFGSLVSARTGLPYDAASEIQHFRMSFENGAQQSHHLALMAAPGPRSPNVWKCTLRFVLFAFGLATEASPDFRTRLGDEGFRVIIVAVSEIAGDSDVFVDRIKPRPKILGDGRRYMDWTDVPEHDAHFHTWPCYDMTRLKLTIGYSHTRYRDLFTCLQPEIIMHFRPVYFVSENSDVNSYNAASHSEFHRKVSSAYRVCPNTVDASCLGGATAHTRDIALGVRLESCVYEMDIYDDSGMSCTPKPLSKMLSEPEAVPKGLWITREMQATLVKTCPPAVDRLFAAMRAYPYVVPDDARSTCVQEHENAYLCNLFAWRRVDAMTIDPEKGLDVVEAFMFSVLMKAATRADFKPARFEVRLLELAGLAQGDIYATLGHSNSCTQGKFGRTPPKPSCDGFALVAIGWNASTSLQRVYDSAMKCNTTHPELLKLRKLSLKLERPQADCKVELHFADRRGLLRDTTHVTMAHPLGFLNGSDTKGNKVYYLDGPAVTDTRYNTDRYLQGDSIRQLTLVERCRKKGLDSNTQHILQNISKFSASRMIASCIPNEMLVASYLTIFKHEVARLERQPCTDAERPESLPAQSAPDEDEWSTLAAAEIDVSLLEECCHWADDVLRSGRHDTSQCSLECALAELRPAPKQVDLAEHTAYNKQPLVQATDGPNVRAGPIKHVPKVPTSGWPRMISETKQPAKYWARVWRVAKYHAIYHHKPDAMERTIRANPGVLGCEPGDSRYLGKCEYCERNVVTLRKSHDSGPSIHPLWHRYGIGEHFYMDTKTFSVRDVIAKTKYVHIFISSKGRFIIAVPVRSLDTTDFLAAIRYVQRLLKIRFEISVKLITTDGHMTFKEQHRFAMIKAQLGLIVDCMPPDLHHWNLAELAIKLWLAGIRIRLTAMGSIVVAGRKVDPLEYAIACGLHVVACMNTSGNSGLEGTLHVHNSPDAVLASVNNRHIQRPTLFPFGALAMVTARRRSTEQGLATQRQLDPINVKALYLFPASYCSIKDRLTEQSKSSIFLDLNHKSRCRMIVSGDFKVDMKHYVDSMPGAYLPRDPAVGELESVTTTPPTRPMTTRRPAPLSIMSFPIRDTTQQAAEGPNSPESGDESSSPSTQQAPGDDCPKDDDSPAPADVEAPASPSSDTSEHGAVPAPDGPSDTTSEDEGSGSDGLPEASPLVRRSARLKGLTSAPEPHVGETVARIFSGRMHLGKVVERVQHAPDDDSPGTRDAAGNVEDVVWRVVYDDGDAQDMTLSEIKDARAVLKQKLQNQGDQNPFTPGAGLLYLLRNEKTGRDEFTPIVLVEQNYREKTRGKRFKYFHKPHNRREYNDETVWLVRERDSPSNKLAVTLHGREHGRLWKFHGQSVANVHVNIVRQSRLHGGYSSLIRENRSIRRVNYPRRSRDFLECHRAITTKEYLSAGGTSANFVEEVLRGDVTYENQKDTLSSRALLDIVAQMRTEPAFEALVAERVEDIDLTAECYLHSESLWGEVLPNHYYVARNHHQSFMHDSPNDHLFGQHLDPNETIAEYLRTYKDDKTAEVYLMYACHKSVNTKATTSTLMPGDVVLKPELIAEFKDMDDNMKERFIVAITKEIDGLCQLGTFKVEVLPPDRTAIKTKLVLKVKMNADGTHAKDKARLVAKGFMAKIGLDFYSVFSPMAMLETARTVLATAVRHGCPVAHADVPMAFIQQDMPEDTSTWVYPPAGVEFNMMNHLRKKYPNSRFALRLMKALYGLKQSPALWNGRIDEFMGGQGFKRSTSDSCLYTSGTSDKWRMVSLSVDDLLVTGTDSVGTQIFRTALNDAFGDCTWNNNCSSFLGVDLKYNQVSGSLKMSCVGKIDGLFDKFPALQKVQPSRIPYHTAFKKALDSENKALSEVQECIKNDFASIVGACIYMSITCRPDIVTLCNKACKGMHDPKFGHILYLEHLLKYLKGTREDGLVYKANGSTMSNMRNELQSKYVEYKYTGDLPIFVFSDANFADMADEELRSTSGHAVYVYDNLVSWSSKRQTLTARSTFQAELIAASSAADVAAWYFNMASELRFIFFRDLTAKQAVPPIPLLIDNVNALSCSNHPKQTPASKHVHLRDFRIRDYVKNEVIRCLWVPTPLNAADFFTKPMGPTLFQKFKSILGVSSKYVDHDFILEETFFSYSYGTELELGTFDSELSLAPWSWIHDKPWSSYSDDVTFTDECRVAYLSEYSDMDLIYCHGESIQQAS